MLHFFLFYLTQPTVLKYIYRNSYVCAKKKKRYLLSRIIASSFIILHIFSKIILISVHRVR